jgi:outer membrane protein assembly factor BamD
VIRTFALVCALFACACAAKELFPEGSPEERFAHADDYLARGKDQRAIEAYRILARTYIGTDWEERARIGIARSYRAGEDYPAAIQEYETLLRRFPRSIWVDDAAFEIGLCYADQRKRYDLDPDMNQKALDQFNEFLADYPESDLVPRAREEVLKARTLLARKTLENASTYMKIHRYAAARFYCQIVVDDYPETPLVPEALYTMARAHAREGTRDKALEIESEMRRRFPESPWTARLGDELRLPKRKEGERS